MSTSKKAPWDVSDVQDWGPDKHELGATIPTSGNSDDFETGGWRSLLPDIDYREVHRLHALLLLLPRRLDHHRERQGRGYRPQALQGLRHLRQRVPGQVHRHED